MINIRDILDAVPEAILRRGEDYYENESILSLSRSAEGIYSGKVCGSGGETYKVQVHSSDSGEVSDYSCTCPYDYGDVCKHIVAVLLAIEDGNYENTNAAASKAYQPASPIPELPELLQDLPRGKLLSIILNQAELDEGFKSRLILETAPPDIKSDLAIIREKIRRAIRVNSDSDFIDDTSCDAICDELSDCLDLAKNRMDLGQTLTAFEIALHVLLTGADLMSSADSSFGSLSYVMDESFAGLEEICRQLAGKAEEADRKACYDRLCREALNKVFNSWKDWRYDLLKIAALLVTQESRDRMDAALKALKDAEEEKSWSAYEQTQEDLVRLEVIQVLEGEKAARAFINSRLENVRFRELAY